MSVFFVIAAVSVLLSFYLSSPYSCERSRAKLPRPDYPKIRELEFELLDAGVDAHAGETAHWVVDRYGRRRLIITDARGFGRAVRP